MALRNNKGVYIGFLIASLILVGMYLSSRTKASQDPINQKTSLISTLFNVNAVEFTKDGLISRHLNSPKIKHNANSLKNIINSPIIHITKNNKPWKITSDKAVLTEHNKKIMLEGHVDISQYEAGKIVSQLLTSKLFYYPDSQLVDTTEEITYINQGTTLHSKGLKADLNKETVELVSNARGIHEKNHT